ncbi:hypothetical protein B0H14DRAFT_2639418 [Mycena olivaceomarginata]|nr:hypothetical protein B0H14DRAFT_2639418 [Mycena olivaceomarginata]
MPSTHAHRESAIHIAENVSIGHERESKGAGETMPGSKSPGSGQKNTQEQTGGLEWGIGGKDKRRRRKEEEVGRQDPAMCRGRVGTRHHGPNVPKNRQRLQ